MQREVSIKIMLGENLNLLRHVTNVPSVDNVANLRNVFRKVGKLGNLWDKGEADAELARYIPGLTEASRQGQNYNIKPKKAYAAQPYVDLKNIRIYNNFSCKHIHQLQQLVVILPIQIKKKTG